MKLEFSLILVDQTTRFVRSVLRNWGFQMEIFLFFLLSKFSFFFERKGKRKKVRKEEKGKRKEKSIHQSNLYFFFGCKEKLLFGCYLLYTPFSNAGKGQQCLTILKQNFTITKRNNIRVGTALYFFLSHFFLYILHLLYFSFSFGKKMKERKKGLFLCDFIFKLFSFLKRNKNHEIPGWSCQ